jgi:CRISPR/Cas system-associated protein Csx1
VRSILVATWGRPFEWSLVKYWLGDKAVESYSTLPALLKYADPKPEQAIIIALIPSPRKAPLHTMMS